MSKAPELSCPHCEAPIFRASQDGSRVKVRTNILVLHKAGSVEINCPACSKGVLVPLVVAPGPVMLKKADEQQSAKLVVRRT